MKGHCIVPTIDETENFRNCWTWKNKTKYYFSIPIGQFVLYSIFLFEKLIQGDEAYQNHSVKY